jgi:hypothetical protein
MRARCATKERALIKYKTTSYLDGGQAEGQNDVSQVEEISGEDLFSWVQSCILLINPRFLNASSLIATAHWPSWQCKLPLGPP